MFLWSNTAKKVKYGYRNTGLWARACWNGLSLWGLYVMLIPALFAVLAGRTFMRNVPSDSILHNILFFIVFVLIYFGGVYATYRHAVWRREHI